MMVKYLSKHVVSGVAVPLFFQFVRPQRCLLLFSVREGEEMHTTGQLRHGHGLSILSASRIPLARHKLFDL
jgi:hypothetical protein